MTALKSLLLSRLPWIEHGFGTRDSAPPGDLIVLKQVHSATVIVARDPAGSNPPGIGDALVGDALVTNQPGLALPIRTADCVPILLADTRNHAIAAIHAGWRGSAARIAEAAIKRMRAEFGTEPTGVLAALGPAIGVCCYSVGEEVARQFGYRRAMNLDLAEENRKQLLAAGVPEAGIETLAICTRCDSQRFHSYRRDREDAGRQISFIRIVRAH